MTTKRQQEALVDPRCKSYKIVRLANCLKSYFSLHVDHILAIPNSIYQGFGDRKWDFVGKSGNKSLVWVEPMH